MTGLTPVDVEAATTILTWARESLAVENPSVGRPHGNQVVCPFVGHSIDNNAFRVVFHHEVNGLSVEQVEAILLTYIQAFKTLPPFQDRNNTTKALLVVFPNIEPGNFGVLDVAHGLLKTKFVNSGLMLGQFHPTCRVPGIWNPRFRPSVSPYPLVAIRSMTLHDIVFLHESPEWFAAYSVRFGDRFRRDHIDQDARAFADLYYKALEEYRVS